MIRLASDPQARRPAWPPVTPGAQAQPGPAGAGRPGHAWPFLSRPSPRPQAQDGVKPQRGDSAI